MSSQRRDPRRHDEQATADGRMLSTEERDALVLKHLPLARGAVAELSGRLPRHVWREDLLSAAMYGLAQAARAFEPGRGVPFHRFAIMRIRGALLDELRGDDWASRSVRAVARRADATAERLTATLARPPSISEVAGAMGVAESVLHANAADRSTATVLRFEAMPGERAAAIELVVDEEATPDQRLLAEEERDLLRTAIAHLPDRLREVVIASYLQEQTLRDIAMQLGVTESRVSQMRTEALSWLREGMAVLAGEDRSAREKHVGSRAARRRDGYLADLVALRAA